jgi:hypothetical protein
LTDANRILNGRLLSKMPVLYSPFYGFVGGTTCTSVILLNVLVEERIIWMTLAVSSVHDVNDGLAPPRRFPFYIEQKIFHYFFTSGACRCFYRLWLKRATAREPLNRHENIELSFTLLKHIVHRSKEFIKFLNGVKSTIQCKCISIDGWQVRTMSK